MGYGKPPLIRFRPSFSFESFQKPRFINLPTIDRIRSPLSSAAVSPSAGVPTTNNLSSLRKPVDRVKGYFDGLRSPGLGPLRDEDDVEKQSMVSVDMRDNLLEQPNAAAKSGAGRIEELKSECARVLDGIGMGVGERLWQDKRLLGGGFAIVATGVLW